MYKHNGKKQVKIDTTTKNTQKERTTNLMPAQTFKFTVYREDTGAIYNLELEPTQTIEDLKAILEAEV